MHPGPNILWICTDQQRYDTVRCLGNPHIRTPNLDRLCDEGVAFSRVYCQSPICTPSRSSFLTGLYASTVHGNINGNRRFRLPEKARLITKHLADLGYYCGLVGHLHLSSLWKGLEERTDDGYREFRNSLNSFQFIGQGNQYTDWLESLGKIDEVLDQSERDDKLRRGVKYRENVPFELHHTTWCADQAIDFILRRHDGPWLLNLNVFDPHPPFDAPDDFRKPYETADLPLPLFRESDLEVQRRLSTHMFQGTPQKPGPRQLLDKASYYGMIEIIDRNVGRILEVLEQTGQRENTMVIFSSDHGETLGDHGLQQKGCRFSEGLVRVPLIMSWPKRFRSGLRSDALVELTDIAPTLAELVEEPLPWTQGRSLLPILTGKAPPEHHRDSVRCEYYDVVDMKWGTGQDPDPPSYATMYRDRRYKLCVYHGNDYGELYDLVNDPNEFENLWEVPEARELRYRLLKESFDASMVITDPGSTRIGRF